MAGIFDQMKADAGGGGAAAPASVFDQMKADASAPAPAAPAVGKPSENPFLRVLRMATPSSLAASLVTPEGRADVADSIAGGIRGAGSIGATLLAPGDVARDAARGRGLSLESNRERRQDMDGALQNLGADTSSLPYQVGKVGTEVGGTMGVGGLLGNALARSPMLVRAIPGLADAVRTGGMSAGGATGVGGMATRAAGGAVTGAASAGLVNPEDARSGAITGAVAPPIIAGAGAVGTAVGAQASKQLAAALAKYNRDAPLNKTIQDSVEAGYVIPPSSVNPSTVNKLLESVSGKMATQQIVSTKNTEVTGKLVRESLGIPADAPLNQGALETLRKTAGKAYAEVSSISPQAAADLEALKTARNEASGWFKAYNRSARPDDLAKAKEFRAQSDQLETALETHAANAGRPELIPALRDARQQIAKTYTVGRAINDASGTIDARVLGRMYEKGDPLSGGLEKAGRFASAFPTAAKSPQQIGSPDVHNLKAMASMLMMTAGGAGAGYAAGGDAKASGVGGVLAGALPLLAPPAARSMLLRNAAQQALIAQAPKGSTAAMLAQLLRNQSALEGTLLAAPTTGAALTGQ